MQFGANRSHRLIADKNLHLNRTINELSAAMAHNVCFPVPIQTKQSRAVLKHIIEGKSRFNQNLEKNQ